jgi:hypothetical protein
VISAPAYCASPASGCGARLLILPGGHGDYLGEVTTPQPNPRYPALTAGLVAEFLDAP